LADRESLSHKALVAVIFEHSNKKGHNVNRIVITPVFVETLTTNKLEE
jgi:hypothetical protein